MGDLIALGDVAALEPAISGHKAAELARATAAGLPALPGWVLPLGESVAALEAGRAAIRDGSLAAGILAVSSAFLDDEILGQLTDAVQSLGGSVVVRSSSPLEGNPRWSGAFATYLNVDVDDIGSAVRGCWASVYTRDAQARGALLGTDPADPGMAVLIQPFVAFTGGGVASVAEDDRVSISFTPGSPAELLSGSDDGVSVQWSGDGPAPAGLPEGLTESTAAEVAHLALGVRSVLHDDAIEWGVASGVVSLLQARRVERPVERARGGNPRHRYPPAAARLALAAATCAGPLGEAWVVPWALTLDHLPPADHIEVLDLDVAIEQVKALAGGLVGAAWGIPADRVHEEVTATFRAVLGPEPSDGLARLATVVPPDQHRAARLLGLVAAIGDSLTQLGAIDDAEQVWRLTPTDLDDLARGGSVVVRTGPDRWEPFVFSVAQDRGVSRQGRSASSGIGAGQTFMLDVRKPTPPPSRRVLAVSTVVPHLASLLWGAAGLVAGSGNEGAHLFEVARSLGVPAVIGVDPRELEGCVVAIDGDAGAVSVLDPGVVATSIEMRSSRERRTG